jgi:SAM-dependent methyltransferase
MSDPQGLVFDPVAEHYDRGRPGWPIELVDGVSASTVLDLAAGTGKLTSLLVAHYPHVIAVEPLAGMRAVLEQNVGRAEVLAGSAEAILLAAGSVDAVFVAEAFHWFDSVRAAAEIARVLRPGGTLVVCFNDWREAWETPPEVREVVAQRAAGLPPPGGVKVQSGEWKRGFDGAAFTPLVERPLEHEATFDREGVASYYVSISSLAQLPPESREELRQELLELLPDRVYTLRLVARAFTAVRR